jgi:hypothetical protein
VPVASSLNRFALDQCCGTAIIRLVSTITGVFCIVSKDCGDGCFPSGYSVDCINFADLEDDDEVEVFCRPDCVYGHPTFIDPCSGGGGGDDPCESGECPEGFVACDDDPNHTCQWVWTGPENAPDWNMVSACPSIIPEEGEPEVSCDCKCKPNRIGAFDGEVVQGACCKAAA